MQTIHQVVHQKCFMGTFKDLSTFNVLISIKSYQYIRSVSVSWCYDLKKQFPKLGPSQRRTIWNKTKFGQGRLLIGQGLPTNTTRPYYSSRRRRGVANFFH